MNFLEYGVLVENNSELYILLLLINFFIAAFILKRQIFSILDPILLNVFLISIYSTTTLFMYILGYTSNYYLLNYILCYFLLMIGLNINGKNNIRKDIKQVYFTEDKLFYYISLVIFLVSKFYIIIKNGIPLFAENADRALFYSNVGIEKVLSDIFMLVVLFFIIEKLNISGKNYIKNKFNIILLIVIFFIFITDGSKSNFYSLIISFFIYRYYFTKKNVSFPIVLIPIIIGVFLLIIYIKSNYVLEDAINATLIAIINRGDTYVYVYSSDYIDISRFFNGDIFIFIRDLVYIPLSSFKLIVPTEGMEFFSQRIERYIYSDYGTLGPNAIYNLMALVYLGFWGSIVYSFITGFLISWIRNKFTKIINLKNCFVRYIVFILQLNIVSMISAPTLAIGNSVHYIIIPAFIYCIIYIYIYIIQKFLK